MLVVCLGTPSFLAYGIDAILSEIFRYFYNCDFSHVYAITFAQLRTQFETLGNNDKNVKIFSDLPSYELSKVTISTKAPILFAQDDFETLVLTLIAERKMDFTASTRMATQSFALLACGDDVNNAVHYGGNSYHLRLDAIIDQILEFCRFQATDEDRNIVLERLQGPLN